MTVCACYLASRSRAIKAVSMHGVYSIAGIYAYFLVHAARRQHIFAQLIHVLCHENRRADGQAMVIMLPSASSAPEHLDAKCAFFSTRNAMAVIVDVTVVVVVSADADAVDVIVCCSSMHMHIAHTLSESCTHSVQTTHQTYIYIYIYAESTFLSAFCLDHLSFIQTEWKKYKSSHRIYCILHIAYICSLRFVVSYLFSIFFFFYLFTFFSHPCRLSVFGKQFIQKVFFCQCTVFHSDKQVMP